MSPCGYPHALQRIWQSSQYIAIVSAGDRHRRSSFTLSKYDLSYLSHMPISACEGKSNDRNASLPLSVIVTPTSATWYKKKFERWLHAVFEFSICQHSRSLILRVHRIIDFRPLKHIYPAYFSCELIWQRKQVYRGACCNTQLRKRLHNKIGQHTIWHSGSILHLDFNRLSVVHVSHR